MTDTSKKLKIYPSSSGFLQNGLVVTKYDSACLRMILIQSKTTKRTDLHPIFQRVGAQHEEWYEELLGDRLDEREFEIKVDLSDKVQYSGRCDFIDIDNVVHETKATLSLNSRTSIINQGKYLINHLAQLVSYMIQLKTTRGVIAVGYYDQYEEDSPKFNQRGFRQFNVEISDTGAIFVDDVFTGFMVQEQLHHLLKVQETLETGTIGHRPASIDTCKFCPLANTCDAYDLRMIDKDQFLTDGVVALENKAQLVPKVNITPKTQRKPQ